jgi:uncharacterized membrane protein YphA (DoxX/SURF4 family)
VVSFQHRWSAAQPWLTTLGRLFLAAIFLLAGWPKFIDAEGTVRSVRAFELLPEVAVRPFGYALPVIELLLAALLLLGLLTRYVALVSAALMVMFIFGIAMAWGRGLAIECGCFGNSGSLTSDPVPGYLRDLLRDAGYLAVAIGLARWSNSRAALDNPLGLTPLDLGASS